MLTEIFCVILLKTILSFLTNQTARFISYGIGHSYFSQNLLLSFLLWYDFKIQIKLRGGGYIFMSSIMLWSVLFKLEWKIINSAFVILRDDLLALSNWDKILRSRFIRHFLQLLHFFWLFTNIFYSPYRLNFFVFFSEGF